LLPAVKSIPDPLIESQEVVFDTPTNDYPLEGAEKMKGKYGAGHKHQKQPLRAKAVLRKN